MKTTDPVSDNLPLFQRRYYGSLKQYRQDLWYLVVRPRHIYHALKIINHAFRERLMLVVTNINQCSYCKTFHCKLAMASGISPQELQHFSERHDSVLTPAEERYALQYARQWAEANARMDQHRYQSLVQVYGIDKAAAIDLILRLIWIGNLSGNTWDYWLYRLSFGRFGQ